MKSANRNFFQAENNHQRQRLVRITVVILIAATAVYLFSASILTAIGSFIVIDEKPVRSDAVVVLNSGVEYYPRLTEAASLYNRGFAQTIVINGTARPTFCVNLKKRGMKPAAPGMKTRFGYFHYSVFPVTM
jgi:uncharacterized SAM-binding protein YcdF (DUF218 family)